MTLAEILSRSSALPPAQLQEIADFAEFLLSRHGQEQNAAPEKDQDDMDFSRWVAGQRPARHDRPLDQEPAFGIWADRPEMTDSIAYVQQLRANWRGAGK
ncbi:MAG: DUF2281 domain-containing protein [Sulfurisoma sp.]|nr:DUF2281 domain-containing protein [Sulfurisoma sp.]